MRSVNAVGLDASRLVDASNDGRLASRIEEILGAGRDAPSWRERVEAFFRQSFEIHPDCPSSKQMGLLSVFHKGGSGSSLFDVKPLGFDGSSGGFGWSVF